MTQGDRDTAEERPWGMSGALGILPGGFFAHLLEEVDAMTTEWRAVASSDIQSFVIHRPTLSELDASVEVYRGFGYEVQYQSREVEPWADSDGPHGTSS